MTILCIDTSTNVCSVALETDGQVICVKKSDDGNHSANLAVFIQEILEKSDAKLDAVAISQGPGSYTGLRIGTATAKGVCYGYSVPLIAIDTLQIMAAQVAPDIKENAILCPMIDARRMEVYSAFYDLQLNKLSQVDALIISEDSFKQQLQENNIYFFGNGSEKCKPLLTSSNAKFIDNIYPDATYMAQLAEQAYLKKQFADIAYFDPFYLKEYQAIISKNKVINI